MLVHSLTTSTTQVATMTASTPIFSRKVINSGSSARSLSWRKPLRTTKPESSLMSELNVFDQFSFSKIICSCSSPNLPSTVDGICSVKHGLLISLNFPLVRVILVGNSLSTHCSIFSCIYQIPSEDKVENVYWIKNG